MQLQQSRQYNTSGKDRSKEQKIRKKQKWTLAITAMRFLSKQFNGRIVLKADDVGTNSHSQVKKQKTKKTQPKHQLLI